jgi:hypothetical protein
MDFHITTIDECKAEILPLLEAHYKEVARYQEHIPLQPIWDMYYKMEAAGKFITIVARDKGKLIGYTCYILTQHPHYGTLLVAQNDILYVDAAYRAGRTVIRLLQFAEDYLKSIEVNFITAHVKPEKDYSRLLTFLGFTEHEVVYTKFLE